MKPEGLSWAWDKDTSELTLLLFTSLFDRMGPNEIYELLFLAHQKHIITQDVPPSRVYVTSPRTVLYSTIVNLYKSITVFDHVVSETEDRGPLKGIDAVSFYADQTQQFEIYGEGIYLLEGKKPTKASISSQARVFRENILKHAA